ncbi:MAG: septum site-determining protein MinD [Bacillota bacterium]|nr:septum site-determining protein MinD [Bacillota bacterium]HHU43316.1 septum site-determining protein MinD [Clostridiales bacterium]
MGRKIVLTSGKGGVGKTTVCANLGIALAMREKKVVLVDGDIGLNNLDVVMLVENKIVYDIGDVAEGYCRAKQALIQDDCYRTLFTLPSAKYIDERKLTAQVFHSIIDELSQSFDFVIVDCPAGIENGFHRAVSVAEEALVVVTPHVSAVRDADKVINLLATYNIEDVSIIVNRLKGNLVANNKMMDALDIARLLRTKIKGAIPEDDFINLHSKFKKTNANSPAAIAYGLLADYILGTGSKIYDCSSDYRGFFKKIINTFRG